MILLYDVHILTYMYIYVLMVGNKGSHTLKNSNLHSVVMHV